MKVEVIKAGDWAEGGIWIRKVELGVQDMKKNLALELIEAGWAKAYKETSDKVYEVEKPEEFDREKAEEEYRCLGGRVSDDWTNEDLIKRIEKKKAK